MPDTSAPTTQTAPPLDTAANGNFSAFETARAAGTAQIGPANGSAYFAAPATSSVVTTSNPASNAVNNIGNNIANAQNNPPVVNTPSNTTGTPTTYSWQDGTDGHSTPDPYGFGTMAYNPANDPRVASETTDSNKIYTDRQTVLDQQRAAEIAYLTQQETDAQNKLTQTQANETGTSTRNLAYLQQGGVSASSQAYLNGLEVTHTQEMNTLVAQYQNSIQTAKNAYDDKDFALAESMAKNASDIKAAVLKRNQDFLDTTLKIRAAANDDAKLQLQQQQADQDAIKTQQAFNKDMGITGRFFQYPGSPLVYDSQIGKEITQDQYAQMGGVGAGGNYSDIQTIDPSANAKHSASYTEWQDYVSTGGKLSFNDYMNMDANRKAPKITNITTDPTATYKLQVDQAPSQVAVLAGEGYSWADIAKYFTNLHIDPGTPAIDDALHRQFMSQSTYEGWKSSNYNLIHGAAPVTGN